MRESEGDFVEIRRFARENKRIVQYPGYKTVSHPLPPVDQDSSK